MASGVIKNADLFNRLVGWRNSSEDLPDGNAHKPLSDAQVMSRRVEEVE
jgi:hypothetical protein